MPSSVRKGPKPGHFKKAKRDPGTVIYANRPPTRVEVALDGPVAPGAPPVDSSEWQKLRERTWARWQRLVAEPPDPDLAAKRQALVQAAIESRTVPTEAQEKRLEPPLRDSERDWPPEAASFDGIEGQALATYGAPAVVRKLAADGLAEVERFRKSNPEAAKSISEPLREYTRRLRRVRDRPALRAYSVR